MSEDKKPDCAFVLMRHGMRAENSPSAGLKIDDKSTEERLGVEERIEPGENYIKEAMEAEESDRPYEFFFHAPPLVCKETIRALIRHSPALMALGESRKIQVAEELYSTDPRWIKAIEALGHNHHLLGKRTFEDLYQAGDRKFVLSEGERVFSFVQKVVNEGVNDFGVLCVMPSPLIEAVILYLWEQDNPEFRPLLKSRNMLNYLDYFVLVFIQGKFQYAVRRSYWKRIQRKRKDEAFADTMKKLR